MCLSPISHCCQCKHTPVSRHSQVISLSKRATHCVARRNTRPVIPKRLITTCSTNATKRIVHRKVPSFLYRSNPPHSHQQGCRRRLRWGRLLVRHLHPPSLPLHQHPPLHLQLDRQRSRKSRLDSLLDSRCLRVPRGGSPVRRACLRVFGLLPPAPRRWR